MFATHTGTGTYESVRADAQAAADADGHDRGVERLGAAWRCFLLPQRQYRAGHERACEVVSCAVLQRCPPGHGPLARDFPPVSAGADATAEWRAWWDDTVREWESGRAWALPGAPRRRTVVLHQRGRTIVFQHQPR